MSVPFPKNLIELRLQAADTEIGAQTSEQLRVMKEYSLTVTRIMTVTPESDWPFLLPFPKSLSEMKSDTDAYSFGLHLPQEFVKR